MLLFSLNFLCPSFWPFFFLPRSSFHVAQQILMPPILLFFHHAFYSFLSFFLPDKHYFSKVSNLAHSQSPLIYRFCCTVILIFACYSSDKLLSPPVHNQPGEPNLYTLFYEFAGNKDIYFILFYYLLFTQFPFMEPFPLSFFSFFYHKNCFIILDSTE